MARWIGLDIGGANIKAADNSGTSITIAFPLWKRKSGLVDVLADVFRRFRDATDIASTMTGELADCFATKKEGVEFIVNAAHEASVGETIVFYQTTGEFVERGAAVENWNLTAAANWHALAAYAGNQLPGKSGFVFDIGSTTTDLIPIRSGIPVCKIPTDVGRLIHRELVYVGMSRTPICALIDRVGLSAQTATIARELFATTADAFVWLSDVEEDELNTNTADGRPLTKEFVAQRLARMVCADRSELTEFELDKIASTTRDRIVEEILLAIHHVIEANQELPLQFAVSGEGAWLAEQILNKNFDCELIRLNTGDDGMVNPAIAVAWLAEQSFNEPFIAHAESLSSR